MGMHVTGIRPPDENWSRMKAAWDACAAAGVEPPSEVSEFFNDEEPDDAGVLIDMGYGNESGARDLHPGLTPYNEEMITGFEIDLSRLPADIKKLRVTWIY